MWTDVHAPRKAAVEAAVKQASRMPPVSPVPARRSERKRRTRQALLDAALALMGEGRSFASLGLREIARRAGIVPTAFYRHFRDLEELGLSLVDEAGMTLRRLLREARRDGVPNTDMVRRSVRVYTRYVAEHPREFRFIVSERGGGPASIRSAIRSEVRHFVHEMAQDLRRLQVMPTLSTPTLEMICGLVVGAMLNAAVDILDLPAGDARREREVEVIENFVRQVRVIFLGAAAWRERGR
jgi:AcrR family transcriptional regulator